MWTMINQVYVTHNGQNVWAHLAANNTGWRKVATNAADGVTNLCVLLTAGKAAGQQVHVVLNSNNQITGAYL